MGGIALTIFGAAWWLACAKLSGTGATVGTLLGITCAVIGVINAFLGY